MQAPEFNKEAAEQILRENREKIEGLMRGLGYNKVQVLEQLGLTPDQIAQITQVHVESENTGFFQASRKDGTNASALVEVNPNRYVAAEVFSAGLEGGHANNNDYIWDAELLPILRDAKDK